MAPSEQFAKTQKNEQVCPECEGYVTTHYLSCPIRAIDLAVEANPQIVGKVLEGRMGYLGSLTKAAMTLRPNADRDRVHGLLCERFPAPVRGSA